MMKHLAIATVLLVGCGSSTEVLVSSTSSQPVNTRVTYSSSKIGSLDAPVDLVERSSSDSWFYVVSQTGIVQKWSRDGDTKTTVLDISSTTSVGGERGLLGLTFRNVDNEWQAIINRTNLDGDTEITIAMMNDDDGTFRQSTSPGELVLIVDQPYQNHNGGAVLVGPDNMIYVGMGDGGSADDPDRRAQSMNSLLGKILRIDPRPGGGYDIPVGNPFSDSNHPEIWSAGVRNPWRMTFDVHGTMWVADVGQNEWEEVNALPAVGDFPGGRGKNLGWSAFEGSHRFNNDVVADDTVMPVHEYHHDEGRCSVSGGAVGNNTSTPGRAGWFFFGDYCSGEVWAILTDGDTTVTRETVATNLGNVTAVRSSSDTLYILTADGDVHEVKVVRD
jgi:glucose/arabinose dehydrogenase